MTVTITVANYGQAGGVTETLPNGFTYVSSNLPDSQVAVTDQNVRFTLQGDTSFRYTVTASRTTGSHAFSGMLRDEDRVDTQVGGASSVRVRNAIHRRWWRRRRHRWWRRERRRRYPRHYYPSGNPPIIAGGHPGGVQRVGEHDCCHFSESSRRETGTWSISGGFDAQNSQLEPKTAHWSSKPHRI